MAESWCWSACTGRGICLVPAASGGRCGGQESGGLPCLLPFSLFRLPLYNLHTFPRKAARALLCVEGRSSWTTEGLCARRQCVRWRAVQPPEVCPGTACKRSVLVAAGGKVARKDERDFGGRQPRRSRCVGRCSACRSLLSCVLSIANGSLRVLRLQAPRRSTPRHCSQLTFVTVPRLAANLHPVSFHQVGSGHKRT